MRLRDRHLAGLGWRVCHVPFYEWYQLRSAEDRASYMRIRLRSLGLAV